MSLPPHSLIRLVVGVPGLALLVAGGPLAAQNAAADSSRATITGMTFDSLSRKPLAHALVQLVSKGADGAVLSASSDSDGAFRIPGVPRGQYSLGFMHLELDSLGFALPPRAVTVANDSLQFIVLTVPAASSIRARLCPSRPPMDSTGVMLGFVRDANSGAPIAGAAVVVMWIELAGDSAGRLRVQRRQVPVRSDSTGWYALCGIPSAAPVTVRAEWQTNVTGYVEVTVAPRGLAHRDFFVPTGTAAVAAADSTAGSAADPVRSGTARLSGVVRSETGQPLAGVKLRVWGTNATATTASDGSFTLARLPAGSETLEARYVSYAPTHMSVDLASDETRTVAMTLSDHTNVLEPITVYGKQSAFARDLTGFYQRRREGWGRFMTRAQIEQRTAIQFTDLVNAMPGIRVVPTGGTGYSIVSSTNQACRPDIYLDGTRMHDPDNVNDFIMPNNVYGIEVYGTTMETPPEFRQGHGGCGSVVVWTNPALGELGKN